MPLRRKGGFVVSLYSAFICHASRSDGHGAERLKRTLQRCGRKPFALRALRVFIDREDVAADALRRHLFAPHANAAYGALIADRPMLSLLHYTRGRARLALKRFADAEIDFTESIALGVDVPSASQRLESPAGLREVYDGAANIRAQLRKSAALELYELRARARLEQGKKAEALADVEVAELRGCKTYELSFLQKRLVSIPLSTESNNPESKTHSSR